MRYLCSRMDIVVKHAICLKRSSTNLSDRQQNQAKTQIQSNLIQNTAFQAYLGRDSHMLDADG